MAIQVEANVTLDTSGTLCPVPVIRAKQSIDKMASGQVLKLVATDPGSKADIPSWARANGHVLLGAEVHDKRFVYWIKRS